MSLVFPALSVAFLWGIHPVISKHLLSSQDISFQTLMVISSFVYFLCTILLAIYYWPEVKKDIPKMTLRNVGWICVISIISGFVANLIYFNVLKKHKSYVVAALIYAAPVFSLICGVAFLNEKLSFYGLIGVLLVIAGTTLLAYNENFSDVDPFIDY